jgi:hypothetical protein
LHSISIYENIPQKIYIVTEESTFIQETEVVYQKRNFGVKPCFNEKVTWVYGTDFGVIFFSRIAISIWGTPIGRGEGGGVKKPNKFINFKNEKDDQLLKTI